MLEPRRLAARSVASRMASLLKEDLGKTIGYRIRFETKIGSATRIEVVTEGLLTRMMQTDNALSGIGLIIFDEFHERSLHADLALALSRQVQQVLREDLRILIMSATMDSNKLSGVLEGAPVVNSQGRQFPVRINYLNTNPLDYIQLSMTRAIRQALEENKGDILAFLPGAGEILRTAQLLKEGQVNALIYPLYGDLSMQEQQKAILPDPGGRRKIILATSIAETSLTIEGITVVIDSGLSRVPKFSLQTGLTRLETVKLTKDTAEQRSGRAGRMGPGTCYRLWNEAVQLHLNPHRNPEITDADLAPLLLELNQWGIKNPDELAWVTKPPESAVRQARELLRQLGAIKQLGAIRQLDTIAQDSITEMGKEMAQLPTHPRIAFMLLLARAEDKNTGSSNLTSLAIDIAALLEERDPLSKEAGADLTLRVEILRKSRNKEYVNADRNLLERIDRLAKFWRSYFKIAPHSGTGIGNSAPAAEDIGKLLAAAYPERLAKQIDKNKPRYRLANGRIAKLAEADPLIHDEWLSVAHLDAGSAEGRIFLAAPVNPDDLLHLADLKEEIHWDTEKGTISGALETRIGNIILDRSQLKNIPTEQKIPILCEAIRKEGLEKMLNFTEQVAGWQARIMSLGVWRPAELWPDVSNEHLLETIERWLAPWLNNVTKREELKNIDLVLLLQSVLPPDLNQHLDKLAPINLKVPSGSLIPLKYFMDGRAPEIHVRLQEVFGLLETPLINDGRTKVLIHLLSPARRPVQVTQDLKSFWTTTYSEVRKELRIRYPRHSWPEDPWTAEAVRGVKPKTKKG